MNLEKLVCHCRKVTNGDIKTAVENGVRTFEELQEATNVAKGCKRCKEAAERVMAEFISEQA